MKMPFLSVASRVNEALQDEVVYKFCSSVLVNILQAKCRYCDGESCLGQSQSSYLLLYTLSLSVLQCYSVQNCFHVVAYENQWT